MVKSWEVLIDCCTKAKYGCDIVVFCEKDNKRCGLKFDCKISDGITVLPKTRRFVSNGVASRFVAFDTEEGGVYTLSETDFFEQ